MLGFNEKHWERLNGINTAREIEQQPNVWKKVLNIIKDSEMDIKSFLDKRLAKDNVRVIFTGAGTSAYVGEIVVQELNGKDRYIFEAIPTTNLVTNPSLYFKKDIPTILVSFARSGNSPESVATYKLANKLINDISHVFITCNKDGELANISKGNENVLLCLMPEESNDRGFAMTSSFSSMALSALLIFDMDNLESNEQSVLSMINIGREILEKSYDKLSDIVNYNFDRIVYLGSSNFYGLAKESSLKLLELTRGKIISHSETLLGFRHGPKSILNEKTLVIIFVSDDSYVRKYDMDLLNELYSNVGGHKVIAISNNYYEEVNNLSHHYIYLKENNITNVGFISLLFALYSQTFALLTSVKTGIEPDNPSPSGLVNRVVQGVTIYPYQ